MLLLVMTRENKKRTPLEIKNFIFFYLYLSIDMTVHIGLLAKGRCIQPNSASNSAPALHR
jgi:hypothetical protein